MRSCQFMMIYTTPAFKMISSANRASSFTSSARTSRRC